MQVSKVFHLSVYLMLILASLMMAMAEAGGFAPQWLTPALAVIAYMLVDKQQKFALPGMVAGFLGMVAFSVATAEFLMGDEEARLLSGAHLIVYLSWLVVFQNKNNRQYWVLCSLSILQVAVGSVLTNEGIYGVGLVIFLMLAMWTLSVFSLHQAQQRFSRTAQLGLKFASTQFSFRMPGSQSGLSLWNLHQPSQARGAVQQDPQERWISGRFIGGYLGTSLLAFLIAMIFFLLIPRYWIGQIKFRDRDIGPIDAKALTGFTPEVQLGDIGEILESTEPVMQVKLFDEQSGERISLENWAAQLGYAEPLFRGTALSTYRNRKWSAEDSSEEPNPFYRNPPPGQLTVRQEIELQPIGSKLLFIIHPAIACRLEGDDSEVMVHMTSVRFTRSSNSHGNKPVKYVVHSPKIIKPLTLQQQDRLRQIPWYSISQGEPDDRFRSLPSGLDRLKERAEEVIKPREGEAPLTERQKAERLESYLRDSGEFSYSLQMGVVDPKIDPVEDFLFNRKSGHCEYYASALALMLRAVGIRSRLISGFKGGVINPYSSNYEVQQRHAHAWVEAYLGHRWVPLDATPADERNASLESLNKTGNWWKGFQSFVRNFWSTNVVDLNLADQKKRFYTPIKEAVLSWWEMIKSEDFQIGAIIKNLIRFLSSPDRWFSWRGGLATFVILLLLAGLYWLGKRLWRLAVWIYRELLQLPPRPQASSIEFYERFRKICEAQGWTRRPSQTQREFAGQLTRSLNQVLVPAGLGAFPEHLVEQFYKVRFGNQELPPPQLQELDKQLAFLEEHWSGSQNGNGAPTHAAAMKSP